MAADCPHCQTGRKCPAHRNKVVSIGQGRVIRKSREQREMEDMLHKEMRDIVQIFWDEGLLLEDIHVEWHGPHDYSVEANGRPRT